VDITDSHYLKVFSNKELDMGILRKKVGRYSASTFRGRDLFFSQSNWSIEIDGRIKPVKSKDFIFVCAVTSHRFIVGNQDLVVIYIFPS
jgi:hypothetical protein